MRASALLNAKLAELLPLVASFPEGQWWDLDVSPQIPGRAELRFQCGKQKAVRAVRRAVRARFPGLVWTKAFREELNWWEYRAELGNVLLLIYACYEAPPTCRAVTETIEVEESVPVAFETRLVQKEITRWECGADSLPGSMQTGGATGEDE